MTMIYVAPAAGGRVRQPDRQSRVMPAEGAWVPRNAHYERLLASGDVREATPPQAAQTSEPAPDAGKSTITANAASGRSRRASAVSEE